MSPSSSGTHLLRKEQQQQHKDKDNNNSYKKQHKNKNKKKEKPLFKCPIGQLSDDVPSSNRN